MTPREKKMIEMARETGSSNWLTALPLKEFGFNLNKQEFRDSLALRYGLHIFGLPDFCACGSPFTVDHAMVCKRGGFISNRHNEITHLTGRSVQ